MRRYWMTVTEAADAFGVSRQTIGNWIRAGLVEHTQLGRFRMVKVEDLTAIVKRKTAV